MRHLCIAIAIFLPLAVSFLNSLSIIWLARRVDRDLYPLINKSSEAFVEGFNDGYDEGYQNGSIDDQ